MTPSAMQTWGPSTSPSGREVANDRERTTPSGRQPAALLGPSAIIAQGLPSVLTVTMSAVPHHGKVTILGSFCICIINSTPFLLGFLALAPWQLHGRLSPQDLR